MDDGDIALKEKEKERERERESAKALPWDVLCAVPFGGGVLLGLYPISFWGQKKAYRDRRKRGPQVWCTLFLAFLTTSGLPCLQNYQAWGPLFKQLL